MTETEPRAYLPDTLPPNVRADEPLLLSHLERDLKLIRRYAFVHSHAPFRTRAPFFGAVLNALRAVLRGMLSFALGSQDEYNAAVADVLLEFTRRAATRNPLLVDDAALDEALRLLSNGAPRDAQRDALNLIAREVQLLREQVRAAQLTASENERLTSELVRRVAALESDKDQSNAEIS
jgi:hypothetical protein